MFFKQNKSGKSNKKGIRKLPATAIVSYLLIAVVLTMGVSFSRYTTVAEGSDSSRVAAFVFDVNEPSSITSTLGEIKVPGDSKTYTFTVTNSNDDFVSEVAEEYTVNFTARGSLPLTYTLTDVTDANNKQQIFSTTANIDGNKENTSGSFAAAVETEKTYTLQVTWPEAEKDPKYSSGSGVASLLIAIQADQVD